MLDPKIEKYQVSSKKSPKAVAFADFNFFSQSLINDKFNRAIDVFDVIYCDGYWLYRMLKLSGVEVSYLPGPRYFNEFMSSDKNVTILSKYGSAEMSFALGYEKLNVIQLPFVNDVDDFDFYEISKLIGNEENIFVSLGCPKQELFISKVMQYLPESATCFAIGAAVDFYLGKEKRAIKVVQYLHLEFLWRLVIVNRKQYRKWKKLPYVLIWFIKKLISRILRK